MVDRSLIRTYPVSGFGLVSLEDRFEEERLPDYHAERHYPIQLGEAYNERYQVLPNLVLEHPLLSGFVEILGKKDIYLALKVGTAGGGGNPARSVDNELSVSRYFGSIEAEHPGKGFLRVTADDFQLHGPNGNHQCLLFIPLGLDFTLLRALFPESSVPKQLVQRTVQLLLIGLDFLHQAGVVHTDLSPNNIHLGLTDSSALYAMENSELKQPPYRKIAPGRTTIYTSHALPITGGLPMICDFASARIGPRHSGDIMPGQYRAPEVIMGMEWDVKVDIWALGLTIWDIVQGNCLFHAARDGVLDDERHLAEMVSLIDPPPRAFLDRSENSLKYWDRDGQGNWIASTPITSQSIETCEKRFDGEDRELFLHLLRRVLRWLPEERPSAEELLEDGFIHQDRLGE